MKHARNITGLALALFAGFSAVAQEPPPAPDPAHRLSLFDGKTLTGWEGDAKLWRVENGMIVGGSLVETVRQNEFLATTDRFTNFIFRTQFKLTGTGFVNSGVQMRSERVSGSSEMSGYQCDLGDPNWWGSLYDESRRNRTLAWSDMARIEPTLRRNDWNDYVIRADGRRITTWINGVLGVDYFEPDPEISDHGRIGFQVHGGGAAEASFRNISIEVLPSRDKVVGAPPPPPPPQASPLTPEQEQTTFSLPPGFVAELVAAEPDGGKFVAIQFDHAGRMWAMTALEYPLDANEAGAEAKALFERGGRDRVLVFDTPTRPGRQTARTFVDGLVMPLGLLPYKNGAYVQYGNDIRFYADTNGDGKADTRTNVLTGFGIEDSHLFPHQFTRAPGGWLWLAQGAFNSSQVKDSRGGVTPFNRTKLARWRPDGSEFEIIGWGPCNIWGLVIDRFGEAFIQEANDQGWPMMPFLEGASYPLCGDDVPRPFAPPFPKTGEKELGGTGLSGLALSEGGDSFPSPWRDVFFINNPITRKVQAIRVQRSALPLASTGAKTDDFGNGWQFEHLPDFLLSSDPWFRPVAMAFGPDGCLYVVDWYNQIISHNEVPRKHPERDKTRGRIWRIRHESQPHRLDVPNLYTASNTQLLTHLRAADTWEVNAAWQEITDRPATDLVPELSKMVRSPQEPVDLRIRALWSLEAMGQLQLEALAPLAQAPHRALRREALRAAGGIAVIAASRPTQVALGGSGLIDPDRLVRQEAIRLLLKVLDQTDATDRAKVQIAQQLIAAAAAPPSTGGPKYQPYFEAFEAYLIRRGLERQPMTLAAWFDASPTVLPGKAPAQSAFAAVTLGGAEGARRLANVLPSLQRPPTVEELLLLASAANDPSVLPTLRATLGDPKHLRELYEHRGQFNNAPALAAELTQAVKDLVRKDPSPSNQDLLVKLAAGFHLNGLEDQLVALARQPGAKPEAQLAALRALRESGSTRVDVLRQFAMSGDETVRKEAVTALATSKSESAAQALLEAWPNLPPRLRKIAVDRLASSSTSAKQLLAALRSGAIARDELDGYTLDKLVLVLPDDSEVKQLQAELGSSLRPVLRLNGGEDDYVETPINLSGPFTVETWVKLDAGINNQDSLLGAAGQMDANFYDRRFRVWTATGNDVVVASKPIEPDAWTHLAVTRDATGIFRIYVNGELDATGTAADTHDFQKLQVGRSIPAGGTAGDLAEYRVWSRCRTPEEIRDNANLGLPRNTPGLIYSGSAEQWGPLHGTAKMERTSDLPPVLSAEEARALAEKFDRFRPLASQPGDTTRGQQVFSTTCGVCHTVRGTGAKIGPALDGAGAHGPEALLRNILTPNAAMEAGYRRYRVETKDGDLLEGLLAAQDADSITLRQPSTEDRRIPRREIKRSGFVKGSVMPEGLLEGLTPDQARDLLSYLLTLK